jgi:bifunctional non-homologous end joining protein LigD
VSLTTYRQKRHFTHTPEPRGRTSRESPRLLGFVIQKHDASRLHYDFRLEWDGVLKSWAIPKGPSLDPSRKALAVQVEDHPIDYGDFEGVIPKGQYGGGTVLLWDRGTWEPLHDPADGFAQGKLHFILHGEKLQGEWSLVRMHGPSGDGGKNWLLMKMQDKYASKTRDILTQAPQSVKSKRDLAAIAGDREDVWSSEAKKTAKLEKAHKAKFPEKFSPQLAVLAEQPPVGDQWIHEIKFDGYRLLSFIKSGEVTLYTRNGLDWTEKFPGIARALGKLKVDSAIVDGEAVALDEKGHSDFQLLQSTLKDRAKDLPVFYAFDLPFCDGVDLRKVPLIERKQTLEAALKRSRLEPRIRFSEHVRGDGKRVIEKACGMRLEGIVSKRVDAPYVSRRDASWLKSKCSNRQEFVIIGYTEPRGTRNGFGSLLLGYHDEKHRLVYGGRAGTGFDDAGLRQMFRKLHEIERDDWPTDVPPPVRERRAAHWVQPKLVAEVRFTDWTRDGVLRHPVFVAVRTDKPASQIVRENPMKQSNGRHESATAEPDDLAGVKLTHPDKVLYPEDGVTKQQLAEYYQRVSEWMLPHVVGRPLALVRCPNGLSGKCFFQRNWSETMPAAMGKVEVGTSKKKEEHVSLSNLAGIISLVQISVLEIHTWNCRNDDIEHPDQLIFDLDPGPEVPLKRIVEGARKLNDLLTRLKLPAFLKTTGGKGLHITVPIEPNIDWQSAKSFCQTIAKALVEKSDWFVANMRKDLRGGKIYIDYNRNDHFATAVAPYSSRARAGAAVSTPTTWDETGKLKPPSQFTVANAAKYLDRRRKDPWAGFERSRVDVRKIVQQKPES